MAIQKRYVLDDQKYQGNVQEEENNDQVIYEKKKKWSAWKNMIIISKVSNDKQSIYKLTATNISFTTYKNAVLCLWRKQNIVY